MYDGWRERAIGWRNRAIASPRFRRWAQRLPIARSVSRRHAGRLFDLVAGFVYTQTLAAFVAAQLHELLADAPVDAEALAEHAKLPVGAIERLLHAAAALELAQPLSNGRWTLGPAGAALAGDAGVQAMVEHHALLYADLADPLALLRRGGGGGALAGFWHYARADDPTRGEGGGYSALMAASQPMVAEQLLDAYRFDRHRAVLDVGGGTGAFTRQLVARHPRLGVGVFDLPDVAARIALPDVATHGGDFTRDALPEGYDCITLVRIVHDHDDAVVARLLAAAHRALPPRGRLVIAEPMANTSGARAMGDAYFGWYLWAMGSGRPRSREMLEGMLCDAGFAATQRHATALPLIASVISTRRE
ncbi:methyltransferase [Sphingomonas baiyangensis]|uniref:Methyltransferase domain-containing protein n=1 Tax=Sphingomonas baiyangensis TaxID=2572576 RepID=A0A4U1L472_9SPHN|nr:methyltransferase [Sphingomonas baiyangensis]TKD50955.1 methyltransferase domain-containing protein [Sphingomonas baiyangensis]